MNTPTKYFRRALLGMLGVALSLTGLHAGEVALSDITLVLRGEKNLPLGSWKTQADNAPIKISHLWLDERKEPQGYRFINLHDTSLPALPAGSSSYVLTVGGGLPSAGAPSPVAILTLNFGGAADPLILDQTTGATSATTTIGTNRVTVTDVRVSPAPPVKPDLVGKVKPEPDKENDSQVSFKLQIEPLTPPPTTMTVTVNNSADSPVPVVLKSAGSDKIAVTIPDGIKSPELTYEQGVLLLTPVLNNGVTVLWFGKGASPLVSDPGISSSVPADLLSAYCQKNLYALADNSWEIIQATLDRNSFTLTLLVHKRR